MKFTNPKIPNLQHVISKFSGASLHVVEPLPMEGVALHTILFTPWLALAFPEGPAVGTRNGTPEGFHSYDPSIGCFLPTRRSAAKGPNSRE